MTIVGARCAGSPLAIHLCRAGLSVCLLDRAPSPSDTASTHGIQPSGSSPCRLGVLDRLSRSPRPRRRGLLAFDDFRVDIPGIAGMLGAPMLNVRRLMLDQSCSTPPPRPEPRSEPGSTAKRLIEDERSRRRGRDQRRAAPSRAGRRRRRGPLDRRPPGRCAREYRAHHRAGGSSSGATSKGSTRRSDGVWLGQIGDRGFLASPDRRRASSSPPWSSRSTASRDALRPRALYAEGIAAWPELGERLGGRPAGRAGAGDVAACTGFFREATGPGWALIGDAGHFKDPTPGQGIADALRQAERWRRRSRRRWGDEPDARPHCATGGPGATATPGRCTGSPGTWASKSWRRC